MPTMSENKKAGKADTFLSWTLGVLACLWVAWCCGIGPLYWFGTGLADFGWANVLYMAIAFVVSFAILRSLVRYGRGERVRRRISRVGTSSCARRCPARRRRYWASCCVI